MCVCVSVCDTGAEPVLVHQLDDIVDWTAEFRRQTADNRDVVLFDIVCGDFNFDNISPGELFFILGEQFHYKCTVNTFSPSVFLDLFFFVLVGYAVRATTDSTNIEHDLYL